MDAHTIVDVATLVLAVGSGFLHSYRRFTDRITAIEIEQTKIVTALKLQGIKF